VDRLRRLRNIDVDLKQATTGYLQAEICKVLLRHHIPDPPEISFARERNVGEIVEVPIKYIKLKISLIFMEPISTIKINIFDNRVTIDISLLPNNQQSTSITRPTPVYSSPSRMSGFNYVRYLLPVSRRLVS
jgi:hypothetical protein